MVGYVFKIKCISFRRWLLRVDCLRIYSDKQVNILLISNFDVAFNSLLDCFE